ncbi:caspase family protein [Nostoc sp. CALU 546]|uniref:nSTAND1 domain-containing NTPase n=1 Tax=Nostoc sp. CALU 546 TaxID=1867241 RepID=UPI003B67CFA0
MSRDALVVGINQYPFLKDTPTSKAKHLFTPANDAEAIAQRLEEYGDFRVRRLPETIQGQQRRVTSDGLVKHETLEDAIIQLFNPVGENIPETALLYFIGHGLRKNRGGVTEGFLCTSDVDPRKNQWGVSLRWLRELLQKSPVKQQIVWLDCCYSGELFNFVEADLGTSLQEQTRFLIAASREFEPAEEDIQRKHGVFSKALWQGLDPRQQPDGLVNNDKLIEYIAQTLKDIPQQPIWYNPNREIMLTGEREDVLIHIPDGVCPYKGLRFFDVEDATYFYGREVLTQKLIQHVQVGKGNFLAVLGVSGSGKSSLLRAGLIYQLQQQRRLPGTEEWKIRIFSPGEQPLVSLATAFLDESATDMQRAEQLKVADEAIAQGETGLARLIKASRSPRILLIVDQFEEIFTVCQSHSDRQQFIFSLLGALKQTGDKLCIIFAMRDDFLGKCAAYSGYQSSEVQ